EDMGRVRSVLLDIAHKNPLCLEYPEPLVIFTGFGNSSIDMLFAVWVVRTNWLAVKNSLMEEIKRRFDEEGIEIPFPHLSLYTGLATKPFPVERVERSPSPPSREREPEATGGPNPSGLQ
ncbi:MAG TPA: mechanosensitive ion channel, partial [Firmicutes bacterium]|nr:mechanosensitive ion channel [Bacillota bacterium]